MVKKLTNIYGIKINSQVSEKSSFTARVQFLPHGTSLLPNKAIFDPAYTYIEIPSSGYLKTTKGRGGRLGDLVRESRSL